MSKLSAVILTAISILLSSMAISSAADFSYREGVITMSGEIAPHDFEKKFLPLASKNVGSVKFIFMDSPGGSLIDSIEIGYYVRDAGVTTVASQLCASGCAFIWLAGKVRMYDVTDPPTVILHMPYITGGQPANADAIQRQADDLVTKYLSDIGVPVDQIHIISAVPGSPDSGLILTPDLIKDWNIQILPYA